MTITIRRATPADAAAYARIMGDAAVYPTAMARIHPDPPTIARHAAVDG